MVMNITHGLFWQDVYMTKNLVCDWVSLQEFMIAPIVCTKHTSCEREIIIIRLSL